MEIVLGRLEPGADRERRRALGGRGEQAGFRAAASEGRSRGAREGSSHLTSCWSACRHGGRVVGAAAPGLRRHSRCIELAPGGEVFGAQGFAFAQPAVRV